LRNELNYYKIKLEKLNCSEALIEFDIENMLVYAIERKESQTVIAYRFNTGTSIQAKEWWMESTVEQHNALVQRLSTKLNSAG
jgi:hypothetical protein